MNVHELESMASDDVDDFQLLDLRDFASGHSLNAVAPILDRRIVRLALDSTDFKNETETQTKGPNIMAKVLLSLPLGTVGKVEASISQGKLRLAGAYGDVASKDFDGNASVGEPIEKILSPLKTNFIDKLKALIPGDLDDKLIDDAWAKAVASLSEDVSA